MIINHACMHACMDDKLGQLSTQLQLDNRFRRKPELMNILIFLFSSKLTEEKELSPVDAVGATLYFS